MHNLALELSSQGHVISGSDDEIYNPSRTRLEQAGLLPDQMGWYPEKISTGIDLVILGMHAHLDNPELAKAQALGVHVVSFPEYIGQHSPARHRAVITGSHGKSTTTAMIMHALKSADIQFDYVVGGMVEGFERMVRLSGADIIVVEGDEYLSSRIDSTPKMNHYNGTILGVTGIEWDHMNVFPSFDEYKDQFRICIQDCLDREGLVFWYENDQHLQMIIRSSEGSNTSPYAALKQNSTMEIEMDKNLFPVGVFGTHNMANMSLARHISQQFGLSDEQFFRAMSSFRGVGKRLELIKDDPLVYLDYAHAPSKVRATVLALRNRFPHHRILTIYELHTYSSLNHKFLPNYHDTLVGSDRAVVYFDEHALKMKRMPMLATGFIEKCFAHDNLVVYSERDQLEEFVKNNSSDYDTILLMSSGNFGGLDLNEI